MIRENILKELRTMAAQDQMSETENGNPFILLHPDACSSGPPGPQHDYIEMIYVCSGHITCLSSETTLQAGSGELLFLNPDFPRQICSSGPEDTAVSFFILPEFFSHMLSSSDCRQSPLHLFLADCVFRQNIGPGYLCFQVADIVQIQNLCENLLLTMLFSAPGSRTISEMTMTLLFLELLAHSEEIYHDRQAQLIPKLLEYIDGNYADGRLSDAAALLGYDVCILSREIRRQTGSTFTELIQKKRMSRAASLLRTTSMTVESISRAVGYENVSFFHRLFRSTFRMTPRQYRAHTDSTPGRTPETP